MAGRNQHHIPQFYQRGFGVQRSGKPKEVWHFTKLAAPELKLIKETAAEFDFYSPPSEAGSTLDDKITDIETPLARHVANLRALAVGSSANALIAAEVVAHLAPRSAHLRSAFVKGMVGLLEGTAEVFGDEVNVQRLLGLDSNLPSQRFREMFAPILRDDPQFSATGLPEPVLESIVFQLGRENFQTLFRQQMPVVELAMNKVLPKTKEHARSGHNKALASLLENNTRREDLAALDWTVEPAPDEGAILPDCVALGMTADCLVHPFMFVDRNELIAVIMPLATDRLLVGRKVRTAPLNLSGFNFDAAACSHTFFLAASEAPGFVNLARNVGDRSMNSINEAIDSALGEYRAPMIEQSEATNLTIDITSSTVKENSESFSYELFFADCDDEQVAKQISEAIKFVVHSLGQVFPLNRLDGITFAVDYAAALASIDIGIAGLEPPSTAMQEIETGAAMTVHIVRNKVVKCRIILASDIGMALIDEEHPAASWALHALIHQLGLVAMTHWFDTAAPNALLKPWQDTREGWRHTYVSAGMQGYVAARISAGFAHNETTNSYRNTLIAALDKAKSLIPSERIAYRTHGDLDAFLAPVLLAVGRILQLAGEFLGHCDGREISALDPDGALVATLKENGLGGWLAVFQADLRAFWDRQGQWQSLGEFFTFNQHVDRILWQFGIFPWRTDAGGTHVEIPVGTDASAIFQGMANGTIPIPDGFDPALLKA